MEDEQEFSDRYEYDDNAVHEYDKEVLKQLAEYYSKSPMELAQQFLKDPDSLTERLWWKAQEEESALLKTKLPEDHPLMRKIKEHLKIKYQ
jgi:hypothetical protein